MSPGRPLSVKGVCLDRDGRVLLCRNWRSEWELPGGRPEVGERLDRTVEREIREETGISVQARDVIDAYPFEVQSGTWVEIIVYGCAVTPSTAPGVSSEHQAVAWLDVDTIGADELPAGYRRAINRWRSRAGSVL
jgi:ADP-ribose pyrophosphatase YjhB (NUDIX family)